MKTDGDYTCHDEQWVIHWTVELICETLKTHATSYVNYSSIIIIIIKQIQNDLCKKHN